MFENYSKLPPHRRIMLALIALLIAGTMAFAVYFAFFRTEYATLYSGLRATEAAAVVEELDARNIAYEFADGETAILVPKEDLASTKIAIAGSDLSINGLVGFELFNESDMGLTEFAQKINFQRALQGELSRTIMMIDGVKSARVHLALPSRAIFRREEVAAKAAVTVESMPGFRLDPSAVTGIQRLVAAAVSDMDVANVSVLDDSGRIISSNQTATVREDGEINEVTAVQKYYEARIRAAVETQLPGGDPKISVTISDAPETPFANDRGTGAETAESAPAAQNRLRNFRLLVVVTFAAAPGEDMTADLTEVVRTAIDYDPGLGDQVFFVADPAAAKVEAQPAPPVPVVAPPPIPQQDAPLFGKPEQLYWLALGLSVFALLLLAVFVWRRKRAARPLTREERISFAEQLQAKLAVAEVPGHGR